jgi:aspartate aminotransferase-like enzyme
MNEMLLLTPGPSPVPEKIRAALSQSMIHHRTGEFRTILGNLHKGLQEICATGNPVVVFAASGTGAMEASVSNFLSSGDKVITIAGGKFGQRWGEICRAFGLEVIEIDVEWGQAPQPEVLEDKLASNPEVKAVFTTLCETSTATAYDIEALAAKVKDKQAIFIVDAISGLGQDKLLADQWGVDVVVGGSQKGLMLPPGLAFLSVSEKAQKLNQEAKLPRYYFDLTPALKKHKTNDTPWTAAVSLVRAAEVAVEIIINEGLDNRYQRFAKLAKATRAAGEAIGLKVLSQRPSASATAFIVPDKIASSELVKQLRAKYKLAIAGGQAQLKDKIIRIAHMGAIDARDLIQGFSLLENVLVENSCQFTLGASLKKFQEVYYD